MWCRGNSLLIAGMLIDESMPILTSVDEMPQPNTRKQSWWYNHYFSMEEIPLPNPLRLKPWH
jgi:hypothetical protein